MVQKIVRQGIFRGFSSINNNKRVLNDIEIVKQDLLNEFNTKKGERLMDPNFGSIIWDKLFDQMNEFTRNEIIIDSTRIIENDSRLELTDLIVDEFEHGIILEIGVHYRPFDVFETFSIEFDRKSEKQ